MNYILNNKIKFEKNRYNKPITPRSPIVLTKISVPNKISLKLDTPIIDNKMYEPISSNIFDFKLKNYQMPQSFLIEDKVIVQNQKQLQNIKKPVLQYYNEIIISIYGYPTFDKTLYAFLLELSQNFKIKIYIHTWNIDRSKIDYYFQGLNVVSVIIDDMEIKYLDTSANVFSSNVSLLSWKKMWTSMYRSIDEICKIEDDASLILNTRFDINYNSDINFNELMQTKLSKNIFLKKSTDLSGVDNPIIGDKYTLYKLINSFYNNLDEISMFYSSFKIPEASIYYENNRIFSVNYKDMFENIDKYSK